MNTFNFLEKPKIITKIAFFCSGVKPAAVSCCRLIDSFHFEPCLTAKPGKCYDIACQKQAIFDKIRQKGCRVLEKNGKVLLNLKNAATLISNYG